MVTRERPRRRYEIGREQTRIVRGWYARAHEAKKEGRPVVLCSNNLPFEILHAFDLPYVGTDHYAVVGAAAGVARRFCDRAESEGYPDFMCSYCKVPLGCYLSGGTLEDAPFGGMPLPDIVVARSLPCDLRTKFLYDVAQRYDLPFYVIDEPHHTEDRTVWFGFMDEEEKAQRQERWRQERKRLDHLYRYYRQQLEGLISFLEKHTGRKFDEARLKYHLDLTAETQGYQEEVMEFCKDMPSVFSLGDQYNTMFPAWWLRGTETARDFCRALRDEVREHHKQKAAILSDERFRILWSGIPFWYGLGLVNYLEDKEGVVVINTTYFPPAWERHPDDPLMDLVDRPGDRSGGISMPDDLMEAYIKYYNIDGCILTYTPGCRHHCLYIQDRRAWFRERGVPYLAFEGEMSDDRDYDEASVLNQTDAFVDLVLTRKKAGR